MRWASRAIVGSLVGLVVAVLPLGAQHARPYRLPAAPSAVLDDSAALSALAQALEADLRVELSGASTATQPDRRRTLFERLAALAARAGRDSEALALLDSAAALTGSLERRLLDGLAPRAVLAARGAPPDSFHVAFRRAFAAALAAVPIDSMRPALVGYRRQLGYWDLSTQIDLVRRLLDAIASGDSVDAGAAAVLLGVRERLDVYGPLAPGADSVLAAALAAHPPPNRWAGRDVAISGPRLHSVRVGIWDSGVDVTRFPGRLWTNPPEVPGNDRDDDGDGYVDDLHGIAQEADGGRSASLMAPLPLSPDDVRTLLAYRKGEQDLRDGVVSAGSRLVQQLATDPASVAKVIGWGEAYDEYAHGTLVASVAVRGNPAVRLIVARLTTERRFVTLDSALDLARRDAARIQETVEYFRRHGARVVNISWLTSPAMYEQALRDGGTPGTPAERSALAVRMCDTVTAALRAAIAAAADLLFVVAAGDEPGDNRSAGIAPGSLELPNLIAVGALDRQAEPLPFTAAGSVDLYANGEEVEGTLPGGGTYRWQGASAAVPQVTNLAAKLLALDPTLRPTALRRLILESATPLELPDGRSVRLLDPRAALARLPQQ